MSAETKKPVLIIVDDNRDLLESWERAFRKDFYVVIASSRKEALNKTDNEIEIALLDIRLDDENPDNQDGIELLKIFKDRYHDLPVVMISAYGDISTAVECINLGAVDFVEKKDSLIEIRQRLLNALQRGKELKKTRQLEEYIEKREPVEIIGDTPAIKNLKTTIRTVANDGRINVLIRGETGTGKELVARAIHKVGWRRSGPFIAVPVVSLPGTIIESELFGYEPGAFTDARKRKIGWIEKVDGGVLFLDEIGDLPMEVQVKLLRFLEERSFTRLGSTNAITVDVQVVSATHQNLEEAVKEGIFREDLYYRIKGFTIDIPPLRDRKEDIPLLVEYFLSKLRESGRSKISKISDDALQSLMEYSWRGNVRQLNIEIERAALMANERGHSQIEIDDLSSDIIGVEKKNDTKINGKLTDNFDISEHLARIELKYIEEAINATKGKKTEAWKLLGLNDRFALRRRVNSIKKKYPHLVEEYEGLLKRF